MLNAYSIRAVACTAVLFGLVHPLTPAYLVLAALAGAYLGWTYVASGNLLVPVLAHALSDFAALAWLVRGPPADPPV